MPYKARTDRSGARPDTRVYDAMRGTAHERGYGEAWRKLRRWVLNRYPLCAECLKIGRSEPATDVHHITPKRLGGTNHPSNLQALCHSCHSRETARERAEANANNAAYRRGRGK
jgi:5-methylcytosine-specific restriction endonuclease McrA